MLKKIKNITGVESVIEIAGGVKKPGTIDRETIGISKIMMELNRHKEMMQTQIAELSIKFLITKIEERASTSENKSGNIGNRLFCPPLI